MASAGDELPVSNEQLVRELIETWPLSNVQVMDRHSTFPTRAVFRVVADEGVLAVKVDVEAGPRRGEHPLSFLEGCGFDHAPRLLRTRQLAPGAPTTAGWTMVMEWIALDVTDQVSVEGPWRELGQAAALLNAQRGFPEPFAIPIGEAMTGVAHRCRGLPMEDEVTRILQVIEPMRTLRGSSMVHGEINRANARRRRDGEVVLLDWDEAGAGPAALDQGYPLICSFISDSDLAVDRPSAEAFYAGYRDVGGRIDIGSAFNAALFHALRYLWWGDTDARWRRIAHALTIEPELKALMAG